MLQYIRLKSPAHVNYSISCSYSTILYLPGPKLWPFISEKRSGDMTSAGICARLGPVILTFLVLFLMHGAGTETLSNDFTVGGCAPNKNSCSECYQTLVKSLLSSDGNMLRLSQAFFPKRNNSPVFVIVRYYFGDRSNNQAAVWFWSSYVSSFIHPPHTFQYLSLFFGQPRVYYSGEVDITLDRDCANVDNDTMEFLTQRVRITCLFGTE